MTLRYAGVLWYLYGEAWDRALRGLRVERLTYSGLDFARRWRDEFAQGREADLYATGPGVLPDDALVDLSRELGRRVTRHRWIVLDHYAAGITCNADALQELGVPLPIRTFAAFELALERCARAGYRWPIAMPNHPDTPWAVPWMEWVQDMLLRRAYSPESLARAVAAGRFRADRPEYVEAARLLQRLSRHFIWYFETYNSIQSKPFYFSPRPQCLFRPGDFRRLRLDRDQHARGRFPFRESAMTFPEITSETSRFASGPPRGIWAPSWCLAVTERCRRRGAWPAARRLLRRVLAPKVLADLCAGGNTRPARPGVPIPADLRAIPFRPDERRVAYVGITGAAREIWFPGFQALLAGADGLKVYMEATRQALDADRGSLRNAVTKR